MGKSKGSNANKAAAPQKQTKEQESDEGGQEPVVIQKWDASAVKNTLDDYVKEAVSEKFPEHKHDNLATDVRLGLSAIACALAAYGCIYGYLVPHPESAFVVGVCVAGYWILMGVLMVHGYLVDPGVLIKLKGSPTVTLWTSMTRFSDKFSIQADVGGNTVEQEYSVGKFIYEDGEVSVDAIKGAVKEILVDAGKKKAQ